ncbi:MAG: S8 family serine peptidase [Pontiellaceae bacterium]|nr:S8 family serine peptidase [Pontiellaceae bacterium]
MKRKNVQGISATLIAVCCLTCISLSAQTESQLSEYDSAMATLEDFNRIQREAGMPEMADPSLQEWILSENQKRILSEESLLPREKIEEKKQRMREWLNLGIYQEIIPSAGFSKAKTKKRARFENRVVQRALLKQQEMKTAREWAKQMGIRESAVLSDGSAIGLSGIRNGALQFNVTHNSGAADTSSVDELWPSGSSGLNLTGINTIVGMWDAYDAQTNHVEFMSGGQSRVYDMDGVSSLTFHWHPTSVAGTLAAIGIGYGGNSRGMAYQTYVAAYDWNNDLAEMAVAYANGLRTSNHSYGNQAGWGEISVSGGTYYAYGHYLTVTLSAGKYPCWYGGDLGIKESYYFGFYGQDVADTDDVVYNNPYTLPVWSAGNDRDDNSISTTTQGYFRFFSDRGYYVFVYNDVGLRHTLPFADFTPDSSYDTITDHAIAKNVMTVGAINKIPGGYNGVSSIEVAPFSSYGPTDDGRIKPDIVAAGVNLTTPAWYSDQISSTTNYYNVSGTSSSAPVVTGTVGLINELRDRLHPNAPFLSSTLKTLITHTADEAESVGPDYKTGWGLLNAEKAAWLVQDDYDAGEKQFIKEVVLNSGDYIEFPVTATGGEPLKVSIGWTDPAGAPPIDQLDPTDLMLINDLDLRIIDSSENTYLPWIMTPSSPATAATTGDNYIDNTEQVLVSNPTAQETYTVRITHKNNLVDDVGNISDQAVSIILTGIVPESREGSWIEEFVADDTSELIGWSSVVGQNYLVQSTTDLTETWSDVSMEISASKTNTVWEESAPAATATRFYRLIETN